MMCTGPCSSWDIQNPNEVGPKLMGMGSRDLTCLQSKSVFELEYVFVGPEYSNCHHCLLTEKIEYNENIGF